MRQRRGGRGWCVLVALAGAVGACETARNPGGVQLDRISPTIALSAADTQQIANGLQFSVDASDNLGLKEILVTFSDPTIAQTDTIFNTTVTSFNQGTKITFPANSGSGGSITITGRATDGAGNFTQATTVVFLSNVQALTVDLVAPTAPAVHATDPSGIKVMGFRVDTALAAVPPFTGVTPLKFVLDSSMAAANLTTVDKVFALGLPLSDSGLPKSVVIRGYACDLAVARNCAYSQTSTVIAGSAPRPAALMAIGASSGVDTVIGVAGAQHSLAFGGDS